MTYQQNKTFSGDYNRQLFVKAVSVGVKQVHRQIGQARYNIHRAGVSPDVYHLLGKCCNQISIFCLYIRSGGSDLH